MAETTNKQRKDIYTVIERDGAKAYWMKIGVAFVNKDGSINCLLNALPTNAKLVIRDQEARSEE